MDRELNKLLEEYRIEVGDILDNVGYDFSRKRWVIFDYGWVQRIS